MEYWQQEDIASAAATPIVPVPPVPVPQIPSYVKLRVSDQVKSATPEIIISEEQEFNDILATDLLFENISSYKLLQISRTDSISGQKFYYNPIKNLFSIQEQYNPLNIIKLQDTSSEYFKNYPIKFEEKIPKIGNGDNGGNVYMDTSGNIVVETVNLAPDEQVEVQIFIGGTIYEAELQDETS